MNNNSQNENLPNDFKSKYAGVKTLVLGATGFIGRWTARNLYAAGAKLFLPVRDISAAESIFNKYDFKGELFELDFQDESSVRELIKIVRPAVIFNLAGYGVDRAEQDEKTAYQINVRLIENVCQAVAEIKDSKWTGQTIIHTGTAMEYGAIKGDLAEDSAPNPTTLYGKSKLAGTQALTDCCRRCKIKGLTARLFAVYGPGESSERLLPTLIKTARAGKSISLTAGLHKRDFVYVDDVAEGLLRLGAARTRRRGEIVNLATGKLTSIREFTEAAAGVIGISADKLKFGELPTRPEEMAHEPVVVKRLRELTDWQPITTIDEGVRKTIFFK
ncbi:MAG: NAD(P)-dependent oxidoreductase [Acidobacteriota bacterium]